MKVPSKRERKKGVTLIRSVNACQSGFFKPAQGDEACLQCPINSRTTNDGATNCVCRNGYYRTDADPIQMPCTSTPPHSRALSAWAAGVVGRQPGKPLPGVLVQWFCAHLLCL
ncbi:hypothetical protein P4O66_000380 [Electrophorus voltai]|uniref:Tyrosine-protein kinase ephrin type A/B receptor-like domain-containing protein n=1 Tax=Electrophorus voltai TaxID=2609070 RepID=A0AAD9E0D3_9TELE|nr:hypothetical protein P4O66_000380 [Electrophorus voltai]